MLLKKHKIGKGNYNLVETKFFFCAEDNHNYVSNMCGKEFSDSNFEVMAKYRFVKKLPQISHRPIHKIVIFQVGLQLEFFRPTASTLGPINFMAVA